jgi:putative transcriptional regulator
MTSATIMHHPSDTTLAAFAAGSLDEGRSLVVSTHLATCGVCRKAVRAFECLGGVALEGSEPMPLVANALERALSAIAADSDAAALKKPNGGQTKPDDLLSAYPLGQWRWIAPGLHWRSVGVPATDSTRVFMLKAVPGMRIPQHSHDGIEWTCILQGAFRHEFGMYGAGDFDEADESVEHQPVVVDGVECICLVAMQGNIRLKSWMGRLIQPFVRI